MSSLDLDYHPFFVNIEHRLWGRKKKDYLTAVETYFSNPDKEPVYPMFTQEVTHRSLIGRQGGITVFPRYEHVNELHCEILYLEDRWWLKDLTSEYGTFVLRRNSLTQIITARTKSSRILTKPVPLHELFSGDRIYLANYEEFPFVVRNIS